LIVTEERSEKSIDYLYHSVGTVVYKIDLVNGKIIASFDFGLGPTEHITAVSYTGKPGWIAVSWRHNYNLVSLFLLNVETKETRGGLLPQPVFSCQAPITHSYTSFYGELVFDTILSCTSSKDSNTTTVAIFETVKPFSGELRKPELKWEGNEIGESTVMASLNEDRSRVLVLNSEGYAVYNVKTNERSAVSSTVTSACKVGVTAANGRLYALCPMSSESSKKVVSIRVE